MWRARCGVPNTCVRNAGCIASSGLGSNSEYQIPGRDEEGNSVCPNHGCVHDGELLIHLQPVIFDGRQSSNELNRFTVLQVLICCSVMAQNAAAVKQASFQILVAVAVLHAGGFALGYLVSKLFGAGERQARTISIEVGM